MYGNCYRLNICILPNSYVDALTPNTTVSGIRGLGVGLRLNEFMRVESGLMEFVPL